MADSFDIVKDSSIWYSPDNFSAINKKDPYLRLGVVQQVLDDAVNDDVRYLVEVQDRSDKVVATCRMLRRFGGVYNYEDVVHRGYTITNKPDPVNNFAAKAGDTVLVAYFNGQTREGIILGGLTHPARSVTLKAADGPQYKSEFNGVENFINASGELKITFKGQPTNLKALSNTPSQKIVAPQYDTSVGSTYMQFDKTGGWTLSDNAKSNPQLIHVDKAAGKVNIKAGQIDLTFTKVTQDVKLLCKTTNIQSTDKITMLTKEYELKASSSVKINTPKVAIGTDGIELLQELVDLINKLGTVQPISPIGPCTTLSATPQWSTVEQVKAKIEQIKGVL